MYRIVLKSKLFNILGIKNFKMDLMKNDEDSLADLDSQPLSERKVPELVVFHILLIFHEIFLGEKGQNGTDPQNKERKHQLQPASHKARR